MSRNESSYQMKYIDAKRELDSFYNGSKYQHLLRINTAQAKQIARLNDQHKHLKLKHQREILKWVQANEDVVDETEKKLKQKDREIQKMQEEKWEAERQRDAALEEALKWKKAYYAAAAERDDQKEKNQALLAKIHKDYTNSSNSSSTKPNHAPIPNGREKSGKAPGGQPGHEGYRRRQHAPTEVKYIPPKAEFLDPQKYRPAGEISKQVVNAHLVLDVTEYRTPLFIEIATGHTVHAAFPDGIVNEVEYGASVKALAYMLNNYGNMSIDKVIDVLEAASGGQLHLSKGLINNLGRQFSDATAEERSQAFLKLASAPVLHTDFTFGRCNGKTISTMICCTEDGTVLYQSREHKGDEGVKGTPLELNENTIVSDHEAALIKHGSRHQECLSHVIRYLTASEQNEPGRTWAKLAKEAIREAIHYRNAQVETGQALDQNEVRQFKERIRTALEIGREEYADVPPSEYYRDGFNLNRRMLDDFNSYVLFLDDTSVPATNNLAERLGREHKRKLRQVIAFRSPASHGYYCDGLSIMKTLQGSGEKLFEGIESVFQKKYLSGTDTAACGAAE